MNKLLSIISVFAVLAMGFSSCSDDEEIYRNELGSHIKDGHTVCYIPTSYLELESEMTQLVVNLLPHKGKQEYSILATVHQTYSHHIIQIPLEDVVNIPDGVYIMTCETLSGVKLPSKINVEFKENMLHRINYKMVSYSLSSGSGTSSDPYIIGSAEDFDMFKYNLKNDAEKGKGQYFKQTASFVGLNDAGDTDRGFGCEEFAGIYDGGGNTIEYKFLGYGKDTIESNRGLFSVLRDGAEVSNLNIKASLSNARYNAGALAGVVTGAVKIKKVYYNAEITSQSGYDGAINIGGLIGKADNATLSVSSCGTLNDFINISGKTCVGGLIGSVVNSNLSITDIAIVHDISSANIDLAPIYSSSNYAGGLIGRIESTNTSCYLSECEVKTAIRTVKDYSGGLLGSVSSSYSFGISDVTIGSYVKGNRYVGGIVGEFSGSGRLQISGTNEIKNKQIIGVGSIGGVVGKLNDTNFSLTGTTKVLLGENGVVGSGGRIGGFVGEVASTNIDFDSEDLTFNNAIMVSGAMCVGGLVGELSDSNLKSSNSVYFSDSSPIPVKSHYSINFSGNVHGDSRAGGAVGHSTNSVIQGIHAAANVTGTDSIGGIVGSAELSTTSCMIRDCVFSGTVKATRKDIGGICGKFNKDGKIDYCINYGTVEGYENVGGIAGAANYVNITQTRTYFDYCVNVGNVTGSKDVAGIVGYLHKDDSNSYYIQVKRCANYGSIEGKESTTGGIVGLIPSTKGRIYNCANHGSVHSSSACRTGGIIGKMGRDPGGLYQSTNLEIGWCANKGSVSCAGNSEVGGIVGWAEEGAVDWKDHDSWVHDCYNTGSISESGDEAGGIIGYSDRYCYLLRLANYGSTNYAIVGDYKYGPDLYDDYTYYTQGTQTNNIGDTYVGDDPGNKDKYNGFDFDGTWMISGEKAILQNSMCPFQNVTYTP